MDRNETITMAHGSGGLGSALLMRDLFARHFSNEVLDRLEDAAVLPLPSPSPSLPCGAAADGGGTSHGDGANRIVVSTDSFVVTPLFFAGGDIGTLAVCGTVNDLLVMGAMPEYLTCGFIIEEGFVIAELDRIAASMAAAAKEAGVMIVAGDTKVIERRHSRAGGSDGALSQDNSGLFINTTGIGFLRDEISRSGAGAPSASGARKGDVIMLSGTLGDHHACILSARLSISNGIRSDCAALNDVAGALYAAGAGVHVMRDVTRGGLGTVLNEIASSSRVSVETYEDSIPVTDEVRAFCGIMGLDPVYMGNEGKLVAIIPEKGAERALAAVRGTKHGARARIIGRVTCAGSPEVTMKTRIGGTRRLPMLQGEGLPRIC